MENSNEEINIVDFINIIIKRRRTIFSSLFIGLLLAIGVYFSKNYSLISLPNTYQAKATIEVGTINQWPISRISDLVAKINSGVYSKYPISALNIPDTFLIQLKAISSKEGEAKNVLTDSINAILSEHDKAIKDYKDKVGEKIKKAEQYANKFLSIGRQSAELEVVLNANNELADINSSKLIEEPIVTSVQNPDRSKMIVHLIFTVILGLALGFLAGLMIAFFKEWWDKNRANIKFQNY